MTLKLALVASALVVAGSAATASNILTRASIATVRTHIHLDFQRKAVIFFHRRDGVLVPI